MNPKIKRLYFILVIILIICEILLRFTIGRGKKFYVLRDISFMHFDQPEKFNKKIDIFCAGGSASQGLCLKNLADRYSEQLAVMFPGYNILNKSGVGIPLSEVNYYLYETLRLNNIQTCIVFSGNNEYLERLNRKHHPNRLSYTLAYYIPKLFCGISDLSYILHNFFNFIVDKIGTYDPYAHIPAGLMDHGAQDWNTLSKYDILLQSFVFHMRLYELKTIIRANPKVSFIYVIPPINYFHARNLIREESGYNLDIDGLSREMIRKETERLWIKQRHTISPNLQDIIEKDLRNLDNLVILNIDELLFKQTKAASGGYSPCIFFIDYCHLNEAGHTLLAQELKKIIQKK
ncbi:MAG: hypothetical protein ABII88_02215 [Candidatus Omnitrophota bacterium]